MNLPTSLWLGAGGIVATVLDARADRGRARGAASDDAMPSDMTGTSLFGGGLIAGDALAALGLGLVALAGLVVH